MTSSISSTNSQQSLFAITKLLYDDVYTYINDENRFNIIKTNPTLALLAFSLISNDVQHGKKINMAAYTELLYYLVEKHYIIDYNNWKRTPSEIAELFRHDSYYTLCLAKEKPNIIDFVEIKNAISNKEISEKLSSLCIDNIRGHKDLNSSLGLVNIIDIMIENSIQLNLCSCSFEEVKTFIRSYDTIIYDVNYNINYLLVNICQSDITTEIFLSNWSRVEIMRMFFSSDEFYGNFSKIHKNILSVYANYIINNIYCGISGYETFLDDVSYTDQTSPSEFIDNFIWLIIKIQGHIFTKDHILVYKHCYHNILKNASVDDIKLLNFTTILILDIEKLDLFSNNMSDIFNTTLLRDGITLKKLKSLFHKYNTENKQISNELSSSLKLLLIGEELNIDLLLVLLEKLHFTEEEIIILKEQHSDSKYDEAITKKLMNIDPKQVSVILKIFPESIQRSFISNLEKFSQKTEYLKTFSQTNSLEQNLSVLSMLQKINNYDKLICGICQEDFIESCYECSHTICSKCASKTPHKCPFCRKETSAKRLYFA